jgi:hypothetical protein
VGGEGGRGHSFFAIIHGNLTMSLIPLLSRLTLIYNSKKKQLLHALPKLPFIYKSSMSLSVSKETASELKSHLCGTKQIKPFFSGKRNNTQEERMNTIKKLLSNIHLSHF